jgi:hypothetical protein
MSILAERQKKEVHMEMIKGISPILRIISKHGNNIIPLAK